jgi:hypothetical protein
MPQPSSYKIGNYPRSTAPACNPGDGRWHRFPNELIDSGLLFDIARDSRAQLCLVLLVLRRRGEDGESDLSTYGRSVGHLAPVIGCSRSETYDAMKSLVSAGLLAEREGTMRYAISTDIKFAGRREKPPPDDPPAQPPPDARPVERTGRPMDRTNCPVERTNRPVDRTASGSMSFVPSERENQKQQQSAHASGDDEKSQALRLLLCELEHDFNAAGELVDRYPLVEVRRAIANLRQLRRTGKLKGRPAAYAASCLRDRYLLEKSVSLEAASRLRAKLTEAVDAWAVAGGPLHLLRSIGMASPSAVLNARLTDPIEIETTPAADLVVRIERRARAYAASLAAGMLPAESAAMKAQAVDNTTKESE